MATLDACTTKSADHKLTIRGKVNLRQMDVAKLLDPKISIHCAPKDLAEEWSQNYSLSLIPAGANKNLSQAATIHFYSSAVTGVQGYH